MCEIINRDPATKISETLLADKLLANTFDQLLMLPAELVCLCLNSAIIVVNMEGQRSHCTYKVNDNFLPNTFGTNHRFPMFAPV